MIFILIAILVAAQETMRCFPVLQINISSGQVIIYNASDKLLEIWDDAPLRTRGEIIYDSPLQGAYVLHTSWINVKNQLRIFICSLQKIVTINDVEKFAILPLSSNSTLLVAKATNGDLRLIKLDSNWNVVSETRLARNLDVYIYGLVMDNNGPFSPPSGLLLRINGTLFIYDGTLSRVEGNREFCRYGLAVYQGREFRVETIYSPQKCVWCGDKLVALSSSVTTNLITVFNRTSPYAYVIPQEPVGDLCLYQSAKPSGLVIIRLAGSTPICVSDWTRVMRLYVNKSAVPAIVECGGDGARIIAPAPAGVVNISIEGGQMGYRLELRPGEIREIALDLVIAEVYIGAPLGWVKVYGNDSVRTIATSGFYVIGPYEKIVAHAGGVSVVINRGPQVDRVEVGSAREALLYLLAPVAGIIFGLLLGEIAVSATLNKNWR